MTDAGQRPVSRARLVDVARRAGVSKSITSRVLNEYPGLSVRPETRQRVLQAAQDLKYRAHSHARRLRRARTDTLAIIVPSLMSPIYARIIRGAMQSARTQGLSLLVTEDQRPSDTAAMLSELVVGGQIDGVIVTSSRPRHPLLRRLKEDPVAHVFLNRAVRGSNRNIIMDDERASAAVVETFVRAGHERIGHVAGPSELDPARRRRRGFARAMRSAELADDLVCAGDFSEEGGVSAARQLLTRHPDVTALYTSSIAQAFGTLHVIWELGLSVPDDLSIISCDDLPLADVLTPPLTTVRMPLERLGATGVEALLEQLGGAAPRNIMVETEPEVVTRESVGPPRRTHPRSLPEGA